MKNIPIEKDCAFLITDRLTRKYLCGVDIAEGFLILGKSVVAFTDARYFYAAKTTLEKVGVPCRLYKGVESLAEYLKEIGAKTLLLDYDKTTLKEYGVYKGFGLEIKDGAHLIEKARSIKEQNELDCIKRACAIAQKAYHEAIKSVKKGITENQLKRNLETLMFSYGAEEIAFDTIVAFGGHAAVPHHETGETALTDNQVILVDMGCKVNGYCSDLTRTAFFGNPDVKFLSAYGAVLNANELAEENITDGTSAKAADGIARDYLSECGYGEYFTHSLGHGVGLEIHEYPTVSPRSDAILTEGTVFTVEPGVYFDGEFGIRIEDTVVIKNGKVERLFTDDKRLLIL